MTKAKNKVISGTYTGYNIEAFLGDVSMTCGSQIAIPINRNNVDSIELVDSSTKRDTGSTIARGLVGGVLLGPVGIVGGALLGKSAGVHLLSINFKDNKKSLIEVDDKIYKEILKKMY